MITKSDRMIRLLTIVSLYTVAQGFAPACSVLDTDEQQKDCLRSFEATAPSTNQEDLPCSIYIAPDDYTGELSLFSSISRNQDETLGISEELLLPMIDANKNEFSPWHNYVWNSTFLPENLLEPHQYLHDIIVSGIGSFVSCAYDVPPNIKLSTATMSNDCTSNLGIHQIQHGTSSSSPVSCYEGLEYVVTQNIQAGEKILLDCGYTSIRNSSANETKRPIQVLTMDGLQQNGICFDNFHIAESSIPGAGRGAFAKRSVAKGDIVAVSPVLHFDKSQMDIVQQTPQETTGKIKNDIFINRFTREHGIEYTDSDVIAKQLTINYSFGHPKSNVLFLPMAPGVNFINHNAASDKVNVYIRWSIDGMTEYEMNAIPVMELLETGDMTLTFDYVALRDIVAGEEIFIDYGNEWENAWNEWNDNPQGQTTAFRHEIILPDFFLPTSWIRYDPNTALPDFIANPLKPGYIAPIRWLDTKEIVTPNAFRIGLDPKIRKVLLEYAHTLGITKHLTRVTKDGNGLFPDTDAYLGLDGQRWQLQRPEPEWRSNMHWLSPAEDASHQNYLQTLSLAGFDEILESLGQYLALDGLAVFHITYIATTYSNKGYIHTDFEYSENKAYNIIIPLILANETDPELDIQSNDDETRVGRYKYEYDVAVAIGDMADHGTSAVDYRSNKEMRLAATIYVADFNHRNVNNITSYITQFYPSSEDEELLLSWSGIHWSPDDPSRKLPTPDSNHILVRSPSQSQVL